MKVNNGTTKKDSVSTGIYSVNETVKPYKPLQVRFKKDCKFKEYEQVTILKTEDYLKLINLINESNIKDDKNLKNINSELLLKIKDLESKVIENDKLIKALTSDKEKLLETNTNIIKEYSDKLEFLNDIKNTAISDKESIKSDYKMLKTLFDNTLDNFALFNENILNSLILEVIKDTTKTNNKQFKQMGLVSRILSSDVAEPMLTNADKLLDKSMNVIKAEIDKKREWLKLE